MDVALDTNSADTQLQATMALGGATVQVDNEMDGDNLETNQPDSWYQRIIWNYVIWSWMAS